MRREREKPPRDGGREAAGAQPKRNGDFVTLIKATLRGRRRGGDGGEGRGGEGKARGGPCALGWQLKTLLQLEGLAAATGLTRARSLQGSPKSEWEGGFLSG